MAVDEARKCLLCGSRLSGRADKKYCSDQCRVAYNNRQAAPETNYVKNVVHILSKNRRILKTLNPGGKTKVSRARLVSRGFDFTYFTSQLTTREGAAYRFCFEQGYLELEGDVFLLVVKKTE